MKISPKTRLSEESSVGSNYKWPVFNNCKSLTLDVVQGSKAEVYAINNNIDYTIYAYPINVVSVNDIQDYIYTGDEIKPEIVVKHNEKILKEGVDYVLSYTNNINVGIAGVIIKGIEKYDGTILATFKIVDKDIKNTTISNIEDQQYTGSNIRPNILVKDGNFILKNQIDYTISYINNQNIGEATITITGKGNYIGTKTATFKIIPTQVKGLKENFQKEKTITLQWSKKGGDVTGYKIYKSNSKTKNFEYVGKTTNTNYIIKKLSKGTTYKFRIIAYKTVDKKDYESKVTELLTTTQAPTTKIIKISTKNKKVTIKWNKVSSSTGYKIYMSKNKKKGYSKVKNITKKSIVGYTKGGLKKNKTYYFKIRTYRTVNGKKVYSEWSKSKSIKVK